MIYFLRGKDTGRIKIGYTESVNKRWEQLDVGAEEYELVLLLSGDKGMERSLHRRFKELRFKGEWFQPGQELLDFIKSYTPRLLDENRKLAKKLEVTEHQMEKAKEEVFREIAEKVFGKEHKRTEAEKTQPRTPKKEPNNGGPLYIRTSVKGNKDETAEEIVRKLVVDEGIWAFNVNTGLIKRIKPGDYICFYAVRHGVIAHARIRTRPEYNPNHPKVKRSKEYPWIVKLEGVHYYPDNPVKVKEIVPKLDMAAGADLHTIDKKWGGWFQGTKRVTEHDFKILTGQ